MQTLTNIPYPYLLFVPKNGKIKKELNEMLEEERKKIHYEFKLNKDKTVLHGKTTLALPKKKIIDPTNGKTFDWAFATNQDEIDLDYIIPTYKGRWRIETGFRVQDEARIKSKSQDLRIRFFYFVYGQILQLLWAVLYKEDLSFKAFIIVTFFFSKKQRVSLGLLNLFLDSEILLKAKNLNTPLILIYEEVKGNGRKIEKLGNSYSRATSYCCDSKCGMCR
jgi:hypothetical protein